MLGEDTLSVRYPDIKTPFTQPDSICGDWTDTSRNSEKRAIGKRSGDYDGVFAKHEARENFCRPYQ